MPIRMEICCISDASGVFMTPMMFYSTNPSTIFVSQISSKILLLNMAFAYYWGRINTIRVVIVRDK